ncbi:MAG TPA: homocysteine S-methyltransferase [Actinomycetota bacterium]
MDVAARFAQGLVLDGGLAFELERRGADLRDELWSARILLEQPDLIREVHAAYFAAGAEVAITASYQASYEGFAQRGLDRASSDRLLTRSVELAREAAAGDQLVAASVGPYGAMLADGSEYVGRYGRSVRELVEWHRPRLEALLGAGPDLLAVETIPAIEEVEAIVTLLETYPEARAWISCSCRDETHLSDGTPFADAAALAASSPQVVAVGVNCTPPGFVSDLLRSAARVPAPLLTYPNLGSTWDAAAKTWRAEGPRPDFGALAVGWREAGATAIGGCCGTDPDDVAAIARSLAPRSDRRR